MLRKISYLLILILSTFICRGQKFERIPIELLLQGDKPILFHQVLPTTKGTVLMATSLSNLAEVDKMQLSVTWATGFPEDNKGKRVVSAGRSDVFKDLFELASGIKQIAEGPGKIVYFVTDNNHIGLINYTFGKNAFAFPPFVFPGYRNQQMDIKKIWLDHKGNLFIGTNYDTLYIVEDAANVNEFHNNKWTRMKYKTVFDKDSNIVVTEGVKQIKKVFLGKGVIPISFASDNDEDDQIFIGTNRGLYKYENSTGSSFNLFSPAEGQELTITHIITSSTSAFFWVSSMEKGIGRYVWGYSNSLIWYPYKKDNSNATSNPIKTFCRKSSHEFYVAPMDSTPAIFNTETGKYDFIVDTSFKESPNSCADIKLDNAGNLYLIKGYSLFKADSVNDDPSFAEVKLDSNISQVMIVDVSIGKVSNSDQVNYEINNDMSLKYYENDLFILYSARGFKSDDKLEFAWKLEGRDTGWSIMPFSMLDERLNGATFSDLDPGKYTFFVKVRKAGEDWRKPGATLNIIIKPPFWKTWWFWLLVVGGVSIITYIVTTLRARAVRKQERERAKHEKELLEMEARALRAQMNPHFIFNCMNSIKALIQTDDKQKATDYLTTFSKLIRTLFQNSDKRQISLYDELETCRLYTQLEAMRLSNKLKYNFIIDPNIDLKSVMVPALIIQPFIENSIWHGIVPKEEGTINVTVKQDGAAIVCEVDDDGIGREISQQNKPLTPVIHESKGVHLSQARLSLEKMLNETNASIETIDKYDNGQPAGTKVVITFNLQ